MPLQTQDYPKSQMSVTVTFEHGFAFAARADVYNTVTEWVETTRSSGQYRDVTLLGADSLATDLDAFQAGSVAVPFLLFRFLPFRELLSCVLGSGLPSARAAMMSPKL
jgi:hypothetical protein